LACELLTRHASAPAAAAVLLVRREPDSWTLAHLPRKESTLEKVETLEETLKNSIPSEQDAEEPTVLEDICVEELAIDGICGVY
jgi:mycofactocin precursor